MRKTFILAKTLLKSGGFVTEGKNGKSRWWVPVLLLFAFASFAFSITFMTFEIYDVLAPANAAGAIIPLACGATSVVIFFFGVFYVVSVMYHADDVPVLLALPLRPYQMLGGKFLTLVVYEYIFEAFILLPILVAYGIKSAAGAPYIIYAVILFALLPAIALSMAAVIVMVVMRFTSFGKNKQAFKFVGGIIALVLALGLNFVMQGAVTSISQEQLVAIATGQTSLIGILEGVFPGLVFASETLIKSNELAGLWNLLLFALCSLAAVGVFLGLGQLLYFKGLAGVTESAAKRRSISAEELGKRTASAPAVWSYVVKELRQLFRSPIAFLNCVVINLIWPVMLVVMAFSNGESIESVGKTVQAMPPGSILAIIIGMGAFVSSANAVTSTAISREGMSFYFMKYIPMPMQKQLWAKSLTGMMLSAIGVVVIFFAGIILGINVLLMIAALVLSMAAMAAGSFAGLLIDVANPKLNWVNEQQAIKQNLNVILHMLAGLVIAALLIVPALLLQMTALTAGIYTAAVLAVLCLLLWRSVKIGAVRRLEKMDA